MRIITRSEWGFDGWLDPKNPPSAISEKNRTAFFTHYQGGPTRYATGFSVPRSIHRMHKANGWKGIGYGHIVVADGTIYEGRGFNLSGSHCPGWNTAGYSAQGHIGTGEKPTAAMLASLRWLYDESCRRSGRTLSKKGHRDGVATSCPGDVLYAWVKAGMPAATGGPVARTVLRPGDRGDDVKALQALLIKAGATIEADGSYGPATEAAVRAFQTKAGLEVDGIAGPATHAALKAPAPTPPAPAPPAAPLEVTAVFMVKRKDADPVYKSDGFRRVHVSKVERDALLAAGVRLTPYATDEELAAFGPVVTITATTEGTS